MDKDKRLVEASWWKRLTVGESGSCSDGRGWVPSLLFGLSPNYARDNASNGDLLEKDLHPHCCIQCPWPHRPLSAHASTGGSWTLPGTAGSVSCGALLLFPGSWCASFCLCPAMACLPGPVEAPQSSPTGLQSQIPWMFSVPARGRPSFSLFQSLSSKSLHKLLSLSHQRPDRRSTLRAAKTKTDYRKLTITKKQKVMSQVKGQNKTPEKQQNEVETGNLPEKEFRIIIMKMIQDLEKMMEAKT